eukprot:TRINITY_DN6653_c0_g1_i3.p1 TRINITY_DN6653_c0_g1~~TRINITY_DN6653_c0_g1_i3.p1  ORF type:complete len:176 (-),score=8.47 TRINITY_DN6653_c0_g1_i3:270-797(-)
MPNVSLYHWTTASISSCRMLNSTPVVAGKMPRGGSTPTAGATTGAPGITTPGGTKPPPRACRPTCSFCSGRRGVSGVKSLCALFTLRFREFTVSASSERSRASTAVSCAGSASNATAHAGAPAPPYVASTSVKPRSETKQQTLVVHARCNSMARLHDNSAQRIKSPRSRKTTLCF